MQSASSWRWPVLTLATATLVTALTVLARSHPEIVWTLRRQPSMVRDGEIWRFVTALFVYADPPWPTFAAIVFLLGAGGIAEWRHRRIHWLAAFSAGALVGEIAGIFWQPIGSGSSVGACGLAGLILSGLMRDQTRTLPERLVWPIAGLAIAGLLCIVRDIHGPPVFAGLAVGLLLV